MSEKPPRILGLREYVFRSEYGVLITGYAVLVYVFVFSLPVTAIAIYASIVFQHGFDRAWENWFFLVLNGMAAIAVVFGIITNIRAYREIAWTCLIS